MDIKTIAENVKAIKEIADATQNIELKSHILDLKEQILELREENFKLKEKLVQLTQKSKFNMVFERPVYWNKIDSEQKDGPYCSACWDKHNSAIRLMTGNNGVYYCPICKTYYYS